LRNQHLQQILEGSYRNCPDVVDSERYAIQDSAHSLPCSPRRYIPKNPHATPNYYPNAPLLSFDTPAVFEKFDIDTLFFVFYYQQDTRQQCDLVDGRFLMADFWRRANSRGNHGDSTKST
jgi:CCR4-NOT transcription complex subunit 3